MEAACNPARKRSGLRYVLDTLAPAAIAFAVFAGFSMWAERHIAATVIAPDSARTLLHDALRGSSAAKKQLLALPDDYERLYKVATKILRVGAIVPCVGIVMILYTSVVILYPRSRGPSKMASRSPEDTNDQNG